MAVRHGGSVIEPVRSKTSMPLRKSSDRPSTEAAGEVALLRAQLGAHRAVDRRESLSMAIMAAELDRLQDEFR